MASRGDHHGIALVRFFRKDIGGALRCRFLLPSCIESKASEEKGPPARLRMDAIAKDRSVTQKIAVD